MLQDSIEMSINYFINVIKSTKFHVNISKDNKNITVPFLILPNEHPVHHSRKTRTHRKLWKLQLLFVRGAKRSCFSCPFSYARVFHIRRRCCPKGCTKKGEDEVLGGDYQWTVEGPNQSRTRAKNSLQFKWVNFMPKNGFTAICSNENLIKLSSRTIKVGFFVGECKNRFPDLIKWVSDCFVKLFGHCAFLIQHRGSTGNVVIHTYLKINRSCNCDDCKSAVLCAMQRRRRWNKD